MNDDAAKMLPITAITTDLAEASAKSFIEWLESTALAMRDGDKSTLDALKALEERLYGSVDMAATLNAAMAGVIKSKGERFQRQAAVTLVLFGWRMAEMYLQQKGEH